MTNPNPHIVITGLMGAGKTTTAIALAESLGREVSDSDRDIERLLGETGAQLAERTNVDELHRVEAAVLLGALARTAPAVIAAAAWVVEDTICRSAMSQRAFVVVLESDVDELVRRAERGRHRRPMTRSDFANVAERRAPLFAQVGDLFVATDQPIDTVVDTITNALAARDARS